MTRIALIGPRGSGKSTVGPFVAAGLGWQFLDADAVLEMNAGRSIAAIFETDGETAFRDLETANLQTLLEKDALVLATGGGVVLRDGNRTRLKEKAFVVWLDPTAGDCWRRIQNDTSTAARRPNLTPQGGFAEVQALILQRRPLYEVTAHLRVDATASPENVAATILQAWHSRATA